MFGRHLDRAAAGAPVPPAHEAASGKGPWSRRSSGNRLPILLGALLAGVPAAAVYAWLGHYIERQGIDELDVTARRVIGLAEARLVMVTKRSTILRRAACAPARARTATPCTRPRSGSCRSRSSPSSSPPATTRCTNLAVPLGERRVIGTIENPRRDIAIEIVRLGDVARQPGPHPPRQRGGSRARRADAGRHACCRAPPRTAGRIVIDLKLVAAGGIVFGERLPERAEPADAGEMLTAQVRSRRFGMVVTTSIAARARARRSPRPRRAGGARHRRASR